MAYESLIEDIDIVEGDSSDIWFIGMPDGRQLDDGLWVARYVIAQNNGSTPIVERNLSVNNGTVEGDTYTAGTRFVFHILPSESALLTGNKKYVVAVELSNDSINFKRELARFTANVLVGN